MSQINDFLDKKPVAASAGKSQIDAFLDGAQPAAPGLIRSVGDSAIALGSGVTQGVKMLTDVAGADNAVSSALGKATDALTDLESPYRKAEKQARAQRIKQADDSGSTWEQVKAYTGAFAEAPLDTTLNALGTSVPTLAAGFATGGGATAGMAARAAQVGIGAAQGVGGIKGQIHESVKQKHLEAGATDADATKRADEAQAYTGPNAGSIALGGALGAVAGGTGAESAVRRLAGQRVAAEAAEKVAPGLVRSTISGVAHEAPMEALQGGQERYSSNSALQGEGFDVPTWQGVAGQAALEGLASAPMGGGFGAIEGMARQAVAQRQGEGAAAFAAGESRTPPESIKSVVAKGQWVRGWDAARAQANTDPATAPAADGNVPGAAGAPSPETPSMEGAPAIEPLQTAPAEIAPSNWETGTSPLAQQIQDSVQSAQEVADQAMKPSERMGLDPNAGALSAAAVMAVDSGATDQLQAAAQAVPSSEAQPAPDAADPETGEVAPAVRMQELQQRLQFVEQQAKVNGGWDMQLVEARDAARAELTALTPSTSQAQSNEYLKARESGALAPGAPVSSPSPATPVAARPVAAGAADDAGLNAGDRIGQLEASAADAEARAADWSGRDYKPNSKPLPKYEAAGGPTDVQEANEQRRLKEVVNAKAAASKAREQAETLRQQGNVEAQQAAKIGGASQVPGQTAGEQRARGIAQDGAARRAQQLDASERWTRMPAAARQALAQRAPDLNAVAKKNVHTRAWGDLGPKVRGQLADAMALKAQDAPAVKAPAIEGKDIDGDWMEFAKESGTKSVARAEMPQIKAAHRGAMTNFMNARGIAHQEESVSAASLKPTQAEFSRKKVAKAKAYADGDRAILVSQDGHVLDGHHQWLAAREQGDDVRVIRLDAPIDQLLEAAREFPSSTTSAGAEPTSERKESTAAERASARPIEEDGVVFSTVAAKPAQGVSVQRVQQIANRVLDDLGIGSVAELQTVGDPGEAGFRVPASVVPQGATRNGKIYLFANNISDDVEAFKVVVHELFHLGLSKSVEQGAYIQTMLGFLSDPLVRQYAQRWKATADGVSRKASMPVNNWHALAVEEAFSDIAEEMHADRDGTGTRLQAWAARMASRLARMADKVGLKNVAERIRAFTRTEAEAFVRDTLRRAGKSGGPKLRDARFSREMTPDLAQQLLRIMGQAPEYSPAARVRAVATVRKTVDAIRSAWANGPEVVVAFDMNDPAVPAAARAEDLKQRSGGAAGTPEGFYWKGKVYLLSSQLNTPNDAARVLFHEALGHHGLRGAFGKDLDNILNQVATMRRADVDAKIKEYGLRGVSDLDRRTAAEEVLAEMAQATPDLHFVKRAIAAIRNWLRANVPGFRSLAMTDSDIIQAFILPARSYVEQGTRPQGAVPALAFSRSAMKSVDANIARGRAALARALTEKNTVHRAMFRTGMGWVDFVWGAEGVVKASGRTKGAMGLSHILEARQRKDGLSEQQTVQLLSRMVDVIAVGKEVRRVEFAGLERVTLEHADVQAILTKQPGSNAWLVSGWELVDSGASGAGNVAPAATVNAPTTAQRAKVSESADSIANAGDLGNAMFSRGKLSQFKTKAVDQIHATLSHPGTVSVWDKTVGTMYNLAERAPAFKPVFQAAQRFVDDVSSLATDAADAAPRILPKLEHLADLKKQPIAAVDNRAIARPIFEGTLLWGRDEKGQPALVDDLAKAATSLTPDDKAQLLLRTGKLDAGVLKMWRGLPVAQYESLINSRFESKHLKAGIVWKQKELETHFKLTPQQADLYREFRAGVDRSIDVTARADMLRVLGKEYAGLRDATLDAGTLQDALDLLTGTLLADAKASPDKSERLMQLHNQVVDRATQARELQDAGYAPLSRFGRFTVDVVDAAGERLYFGMFETKHESNKMTEAMRREFKGATVERGTMSEQAFKLFQGITPESLELFGNMLGLKSEGDGAQDKAFQEYLKLTKNNHSAMKRLMHRKGITGYSEDVGRVLASFIYSNARQSAAGLNMGDLDAAINEVPKDQGELKDVAIGLRDYIKNPQEEAQAVRGLLFAQYLGGSVASAIVNMSQPFAVTFPWLSQFGGARKAAQQLGRAFKDMGTKGLQYEPDLARALKNAEDSGVVSPQEVHQLMAQARGSGSLSSGDGTKVGDARAAVGNKLAQFSLIWGKGFSMAEQVNRRSTFIAAFRTAKEQGMLDPAAFAAKAVLETQFLYSKANKMRWARGAVGGTLMTFKTYSIAYLELMHRMWTQGGPEGKKAVGMALVMLMLMGGAGGLPFAEDLEDVIDSLGQAMGYNISAKQWRKQAMRSVLGESLGEFLESGVSGLPGSPVDVSGRLGMGNLLPGTGLMLTKRDNTRDLLELAGPAGDFIKRGFTGAGMALKGLATGGQRALDGELGAAGGAVLGGVARGALEVSPGAVRNVAKGIDMAARGMYRDSKGYKVLDTTIAEALAKGAGFQPKSVAEVQEANSFMLRSKSFYTQNSSDIKAQWAKALFEKDESGLKQVRERLAAWNRNNPEQPIVVKMPDVWKKVREMGKDRTQRIADTAPKALRAQMREEVAGLRG